MRAYRKFEKYRPKKPSNKLEPTFSQDVTTWRPSIHYNYSLTDIRNQQTPAEYYRSQLVEYGTEIRRIQRLEWRIQKNVAGFMRATLLWQSIWRGYKGRQNFKVIREELQIQKEQRDAENLVHELLSKQHALNNEPREHKDEPYKIEAIRVIQSLRRPSVKMFEVRAKMLYTMNQFSHCELAARELIELDGSNEIGFYLLALSLSARNKYEQAYQELKVGLSLILIPKPEIVLLNAYVCTKINPPRHIEAYENFDHLVTFFPEDMNYVMQRGCALSCLQDWTRAIEDFSFILIYQPDLPNILCLRARAYCCIRDFERAKTDYNRVLELYPDYATAWYGLQDIGQPYEELPMVDMDMVADAAK